jgi:DNA repair protein RecO (recombination protein O)
MIKNAPFFGTLRIPLQHTWPASTVYLPTMTLVSTPAIVLHSYRYGETSKIVRLLTLDLGVQSAVARGAMRRNSKFGASLEAASEGNAQLYLKDGRDLQTLGEFEVTRLRLDLAADLNRFAYASVLAELVMKFSSSEPHPRLFVFMHSALDSLCEELGAPLALTGLASIWGLINELGFAPGFDECAVDGRPVASGDAPFAVEQGGFLCEACARGRRTSRLPTRERAVLRDMVDGTIEGDLEIGHKSLLAHRRLVIEFIRYHLAEGREMRALDYWESL